MSMTIPIQVGEPPWMYGQDNAIASEPSLPKPVRDANAKYAPAYFRWRELRDAAARAYDAIGEAEKADHEVRWQSMAAGKAALAPTAPQAREAAAEAERQELAARELLHKIHGDILAAVGRHRGDCLRALADAEQRDDEAIRQGVAELRRRYEAKARRGHLSKALGGDIHSPRAFNAWDMSIPAHLRTTPGPHINNALDALTAAIAPPGQTPPDGGAKFRSQGGPVAELDDVEFASLRLSSG
jgi:hypothetical protein